METLRKKREGILIHQCSEPIKSCRCKGELVSGKGLELGTIRGFFNKQFSRTMEKKISFECKIVIGIFFGCFEFCRGQVELAFACVHANCSKWSVIKYGFELCHSGALMKASLGAKT